MEILKTWFYHGRIIFLTRLNGKYQLFYKSAGLNDSRTKGAVMPILRLKVSNALDTSPDGLGYGNVFGWIPKAYVWRGTLVSYRHKVRAEFPSNMHGYLDLLEQHDIEVAEIQSDPREINEYCVDYIKGREDYVDWGIK